MLQPFRFGRPLITARTYLPACSHGSARTNEGRISPSSSARFRWPSPAHILHGSSRLTVLLFSQAHDREAAALRRKPAPSHPAAGHGPKCGCRTRASARRARRKLPHRQRRAPRSGPGHLRRVTLAVLFPSIARTRPSLLTSRPSGPARRRCALDPQEWTPRELRHSFVSLLSDAEVPIERISRLVGHSSTVTTETIYRKQIRPVIVHGADVMDRIFPEHPARMLSYSVGYSPVTHHWCYRPRYLNIQRLNYLWTIRHSSARIAGNLIT